MSTTAKVLPHSQIRPRWVALQYTRRARALAIIVTGLLGVLVLFGVGFAQPEPLHDAAHDARHAAGFPCH